METEVAAGRLRPTWAEIDLGAIRQNASLLSRVAAPAQLCAVVKAGGYGHGAADAARAALDGGASWLAVALVEEGMELRAAGIDAPILLLSEPVAVAMPEVVASRLTPTVYTREGLNALTAAAASRRGTGAGASPEGLPVHVKVDTGMHRVGAAPAEAVELAASVASTRGLRLEGFWTHLAVSDELENPYTGAQLDRFDGACGRLHQRGVEPPLLHAANSAAALWHPRSRYGMVRCGISLYGLAPAGELAGREPATGLRPAMALKARVSYVKEVAAGERLSYGLRYRLDRDSVIATVPVGYADGVTRMLSAKGGQVLVGGRRCPVAGTVTMDQILVDCGPGATVRRGDEVVLLGSQGDQAITAWEWAERVGTIAYEVVCGVSGRVPRLYLGG
ncbi:MAG TPA: alanine racemase [Acidimicrobiales bacterium]|nr:alanine racemase [Acidimicrobiales bacterium]